MQKKNRYRNAYRKKKKGAKENVQAVARAPGQAVEAVSGAAEALSGAVGSVGKAASTVKDGAYGAVEAVGRLSAMPAKMAEERRRAEEVCDYRVVSCHIISYHMQYQRKGGGGDC